VEAARCSGRSPEVLLPGEGLRAPRRPSGRDGWPSQIEGESAFLASPLIPSLKSATLGSARLRSLRLRQYRDHPL
jgi:hypothetical protein